MKKDKAQRIAILNGSPRPRGNTAVALGFLTQELERGKPILSKHDLYRLRYRGCAHCDLCKAREDEPGCALKDDFQKALADIVRSDVVLVASPVYCWSVSGCLSAALDRFYCLFKESGKSLMQGKRIAGVFTAGGDAFDGMDLCVAMMKKLSAYAGAEYVGTLAAAGCATPEQTAKRADLKRAARALARSLVG